MATHQCIDYVLDAGGQQLVVIQADAGRTHAAGEAAMVRIPADAWLTWSHRPHPPG